MQLFGFDIYKVTHDGGVNPAHAVSPFTGASGVAVIDTGVDYTPEDIAEHMNSVMTGGDNDDQLPLNEAMAAGGFRACG